jgi:hypothetical protein
MRPRRPQLGLAGCLAGERERHLLVGARTVEAWPSTRSSPWTSTALPNACLSASTVKWLISAGELPALHIGRLIRVGVVDVEAFVQRQANPRLVAPRVERVAAPLLGRCVGRVPLS